MHLREGGGGDGGGGGGGHDGGETAGEVVGEVDVGTASVAWLLHPWPMSPWMPPARCGRVFAHARRFGRPLS